MKNTESLNYPVSRRDQRRALDGLQILKRPINGFNDVNHVQKKRKK